MTSQRPLRVLHILQQLHGYGAERQLAELLRELRSPSCAVGVLTVYGSADEERDEEFPVFSAGRRTRRDYAFVGRLFDRVRDFKPDVVHTHTISGKYWGRAAAVATGVPAIVHTEHNPCNPQSSLVQRIVSRALNAYTARVVTFFPEQGEVLTRTDALDPGKIAIIPNGLAFGRMQRYDRREARALLGLNERQFSILLVGRMAYQKNHELALRALAALQGEHREDAVLLFAGSGALEPELRALAAHLGVLEHVRFLGYRTDVPVLLAAADVLLMTSRFEGMPLTLLESMHAGTPIVTTPWLGARSMLGSGKYGRITDGFHPGDIAFELIQARARHDAMAAIAAAARQYVETEFGLSRMVESHRRLYDDVCARERSAA